MWNTCMHAIETTTGTAADTPRRMPIYDRLDEPTRGMLEQNLAYAESGDVAICFSSGMAAISAAVCVCANAGEKVLAHHVLYGCTFSLFKNWLPRFGIKVSGIDLTDREVLLEHLTDALHDAC